MLLDSSTNYKNKTKDQALLLPGRKNKRYFEVYKAFVEKRQNGQTSLHILRMKSGLAKEELRGKI